MANILVVDDEARVRAILNIMLSSGGHQISEAPGGREALEMLKKGSFDLVITDIKMDDLDGMGLLCEIKKMDARCPVIFITAFGTLESAVEALRLGAVDYLAKPFEEKQVLLAVERALGMGRIITENLRLKRSLADNRERQEAVFVSSAMQEVQAMAASVAASEATVLITGESGTGKEVVARFIHRFSDRREGRFVALNCAAISPNLVESEIFGHEKGSFTGAHKRKEGVLEFADGGTLLLDEVSELPLEVQAKLLRVIQERNVQRVGGNREIPIDVRLISATNQDLEDLVFQRRFRQDLYYRLAVFPIYVPPLRERKADIIPLAKLFVKEFAKVREMSKEVLTSGACQVLTEYHWPGNVRELSNTIERAVILKAGRMPITSDDLSFLRAVKRSPAGPEELFNLPPSGIDFEAMQKKVVQQALEKTSGNQSAAARLLGMTRAKFRTLLYNASSLKQ